jgi:alkylated DNA nucleotide flippase Atl1
LQPTHPLEGAKAARFNAKTVLIPSPMQVRDAIAEVTPWWRVTKEGKPNPKMPGGIERHRALLLEEGVRI